MISLVIFCIAFAIPHLMQAPQSLPSSSMMGASEEQSTHAGREYLWMTFQTLFPIVCLCILAITLTDSRIRRMMRLGPLDDDQPPPTPQNENSENISSKIRQLPLMEYHTKEDLRRMSLHELKKLAQQGHHQRKRRCSEAVLLQDKEDVIRDIVGDVDDEENEVCSICQEEYASKQLIRVLPRCGHRYHLECVDQWFLTSTQSNQRRISCPLCNTML